MRMIRRTSQFKRDAKRMLKRGKNALALKTVLDLLVRGETLETRYRDHWLVGEYKSARECHIEPDWVLIYELTNEELILIRTGSHSDLFQ